MNKINVHEMAPLCECPFGMFETGMEIWKQIQKFMFYFRRAADASLVSFPFHITMGNDGTQQHHEHPLSCVPFKLSSVIIFINRFFNGMR
jgi:hypothetical protein